MDRKQFITGVASLFIAGCSITSNKEDKTMAKATGQTRMIAHVEYEVRDKHGNVKHKGSTKQELKPKKGK